MTAPSASSLSETVARLLDSKNIAEAERICREALRLEPDNAEHHYIFSQLLTKLRRPEPARAAIQTACRLLPDNAQLQLEAAQQHDAAGLLDEAEGYYRAVTRLIPNDAWAHVRLARLLLARQKLNDATPVLMTACACANASPKIYLYAAGELKKQSRFSDIVAILEAAQQRWPDDVDIQLPLAHAYAYCFNIAAAEAQYTQLLNRYPDRFAYWEAYAQACALTGQTANALKACTKALSLASPGEALPLHLMQARLLEATGQHAAATAVRHAALQTFQGSPESLDSIITDIRNTEGLAAAEALWRERIAREGESASLLLKLAYDNIQQARWDEVKQLLQRARQLTTDPKEQESVQYMHDFIAIDCPFLHQPLPDAASATRSSVDDVIIIRGALSHVHLPIVAQYRTMNPDVQMILSTWNDTASDLLNSVRMYVDDVVLNARPDTPGSTNINFQIACAVGGLKRARERGAARVLMTRGDLGFLRPGILDEFRACLAQDQANPAATPHLKKRLIICDIWTVRYPFYHASDLFAYGLLEDMEKYWHINQCTDSCLNTEVNLCRGFARNVGHALTNDIADSLRAIQDMFIVRDAGAIGLYWLKQPGITRSRYNQRPEIITEAVWRGA